MFLPSSVTIDSFSGEYSFLSNFSRHPLAFGADVARTCEHAFQAAKATNPAEAAWVLAAPTPGEAKRRGRKLKRRADWEQVKDGIMLVCLRIKFARGTELAAKLEATGDALLIEGNNWGDRYWGMCEGVGFNKLGHLLMLVRAENRK